MKRVLFFISALSIIHSSVLFAIPANYIERNVNFRVSDKLLFGNSNIYYSCDTIEENARKILSLLAAKDIEVFCSGGVRDFTSQYSWNAYLSLKFKALTSQHPSESYPINAIWKQLKLADSKNCHLVNDIINHIEDKMSIEDITSNIICSNAHGQYSFNLMVLLPEEN